MSYWLAVPSGCSGGGKSTLLAEFRRRGHATVDEPGQAHREGGERGCSDKPFRGSTSRPSRGAPSRSRWPIRRKRAHPSGWVFFDRSLVDAAAALEHAAAEPALERLDLLHRYHPTVFLAPPWPVLLHADPEPRHRWDEAAAEYERLARVYPESAIVSSFSPRRASRNRPTAVWAEPSGGCS